MADLSTMSDEELEAIAKQKKLGGMSDAELEALAGKAEFTQAAEPQEPYGATNDVVEQQSPDVGAGGRFFLKNFSNSPDAAIEYLKGENEGKGLEFENRAGRVLIRKQEPGNKGKWYPLDPDPGFLDLLRNPGEIVKDVTDVTSDAVTGIGTGLATAGGGLLGAALTGGWGALPTAAVAGGGTGAGLEALRQKIGAWGGIPQGVDTDQVLAAGAGGAVAPLLFGTGAPAAWLTGSAAAQRGLPSQAARFLAPKVGSILSGVPERTLNYAQQNLPKLDAVMAGGVDPVIEALESETKAKVRGAVGMPEGPRPATIISPAQAEAAPKSELVSRIQQEGYTPLIKEAQGQIKEKVGGIVRESGEAIGALLDTVQSVDVASAEPQLRQLLSELQAKQAQYPQPAYEAQITKIGGWLDKYFPTKPGTPGTPGTRPIGFARAAEEVAAVAGTPPEPYSTEVPGRIAWDMMKELQKLGDVPQARAVGPRFAKGGTPLTNQTKGRARSAAQTIYDQLDEATEGNFREANAIYGNAARTENELAKYFNDETGQKGYSFLLRAGNPNQGPTREFLERTDATFQTDLKKLVEAFNAEKAGRTTSATLEAPIYELPRTPALHPDEAYTNRFFGATQEQKERVYPKLGNLFNDAKARSLERVQKLDKQYDTNIEDTARLLEANKYLGNNAGDLPLSAAGTTGTLRGGLAHAMEKVPIVGNVLAAGANLATGPKRMRQYIRLGNAVGRGMEAMSPMSPLLRAALESAWLQLPNQERIGQ